MARVGAFLYDDGLGVGELDGAFVIGCSVRKEAWGGFFSLWQAAFSRAGPLPVRVHAMETTTLPAFARPFCNALHGLERVSSEGEDPVDDGVPQRGKGGEFAQLVAAGLHEQEGVRDTETLGLAPDLGAERGDAQASTRFEPSSRAVAGSGGLQRRWPGRRA